MSLIEGEAMTTINLPKSLVYGAVSAWLRADGAALAAGRGRQLAPRLLRPWSAPRPSTPPDLRALTMLLLLGSFLVLMIIGVPGGDLHGCRLARSTSWSPASCPTSSWPSG